MTSRDFCYWLQGFFELGTDGSYALDEKQTASIRAHLALVFKHEIDPLAGPPEHQKALNEIHEAAKQLAPVTNGRPEPFGPKLRC